MVQIGKTELGNTGHQISNIGLGTMYFGSKVDEKTSFRILDFYLGKGGSFCDSANKYASWVQGFQGGESETLIGKWMKLKGIRDEMFVSSKVGFPYGDIPRSLKKEIIISECDRSLKRLQTDHIDLYFAHAFDTSTSPKETMEAFYLLKKSGKIRYAGASNFYSWQLCEANAIAHQQGWEGFCCIQQRHTYLEPVLHANFGTQLLLTPELREYCVAENMAIMAYSPLLGGFYARQDRTLPIQYQSAVNDFHLSKLDEVANELNVSPNAVVLAWMVQNKPSVIPLVTGSNLVQIEENMAAVSIVLSPEQIEKLNQDNVLPDKYT